MEQNEEPKIERKRHGASLRCQIKGCNGNPKKIIEASVFCGSVCEKCFAIYDYVPVNNSAEKESKRRYKEMLENKKPEVKKVVKKKIEKGEQLNFEIE